MTEYHHYASLEGQLKTWLEIEVAAAFGHVSFVQQHQWAQPDYAAVLCEEGNIVSFCFLVKRKVLMDGKWYWASGIQNLITPPEHRGKGFAHQLMQEVHAFLFTNLQADFGLLLCADKLLPFYKKLGWYHPNSQLWFEQSDGKHLYDSNILLLAPEESKRLNPGTIDLNGLPW